MMGKRLTLGLDVQPTAIGWSLVDDERGTIERVGVRIFPEGVDRDQQGGEKSKSQARRTARGMRRQIARRARRKKVVRDVLIGLGFLPADQQELQRVLHDSQPDSEYNPYALRRKAVTPSTKLAKYELGRVILHFASHRGFLSNRKSKSRDDDEKGLQSELSALDAEIGQTPEGTLGAALAVRQSAFRHAGPLEQKAIRRQHTRRDQHQNEFLKIWSAQREHHPQLTDKLLYGSRGKEVYPKVPERIERPETLIDKYGLYGLIYFQRAMYWPKSIVGRCELEPKEKRCPRAHRAAQAFRILQEVNNLRILDRTIGKERNLTPAERRTLVDYLSDAEKRTFDQIRKKLKFHEQVQFNLERAERDKLDGHKTNAALASKKRLGKRWSELSEVTKDQVVEILIEEERDDAAVSRLIAECGLTPEEAVAASKAPLPDGYASYSLKAIRTILPYLQPEEGRLLMGNDARDSALHAAGYLRPDEKEVKQRDELPIPPNLPNPIVRQAMYEVRKVVNAILRRIRKDGDKLVAIRVELAREAKKSQQERDRLRFDNAKRRRARENARGSLAKDCRLENPRRAEVDKYLLWKEQEGFCPYCGVQISPFQLSDATGESEIDHILPRWRSLDNSMANKVVCHTHCNKEKKDRTPREWLEYEGKDLYEKVLRCIERLPYNKQLKFRQEHVELTDFVDRQLRDTAYISRLVHTYLRCLGVPVTCNRGQMTQELRRYWQLNTIIGVEGQNEKNRTDLRHHAIDAIVVAFTNAKRLNALATAKGKNVVPPSAHFLQQARSAIYSIKVSHRPRRRITGHLHEATIYGPTNKPPEGSEGSNSSHRPWAKAWIEDPKTFVRRKFVDELTDIKHLEKVRDPTIREILKNHLRNKGMNVEKGGKIPGEAFKGANVPKMPSGVPIKKVRMLEESETFRRVSASRSFQYVKPGNNHHIKYIASGQGDAEVWRAEVVTMWDVAKRARQESGKAKGRQQSLVDRTVGAGERFVMSLSMGEMFEIVAPDGEILLCVVRKIDQRSRRVYYKLHQDGREAADINKDNLYLSPAAMKQRDARKVTVDAVGNVYWAND